MTRNQSIVLGLVFVAIVGSAGAYWVSSSRAFTPCINQWPYGQGSSGSCVRVIQDVTYDVGYYQSATGGYFKYGPKSDLNTKYIDSSFGPITARQVENYQRWKNIRIDGVVGRQTWTTMCELRLPFTSNPDRYTACGY